MIEIGIICVTNAEINAVMLVFGIEKSDFVKKNGRHYYETVMRGADNAEHRVIFAYITEKQGNNISAVVTSNFISDWAPSIICLVGIAGGNRKNDIKLCDVLVPKYIYDITIKQTCEVAKLAQKTTNEPPGAAAAKLNLQLLVRENPARVHHRLKDCISTPLKMWRLAPRQILNDLRELAKKRKELQSFVDEYRRDPKKLPAVHTEEVGMLSDNVLWRNVALFNAYAEKLDNIKGAEMEAAGFVLACEHATPNPIPWIVVKSVSDYCGSNKNSKKHRISATLACITLRRLLEHLPTNDLKAKRAPEEEESKEDLTESYIVKLWRNKKYEEILGAAPGKSHEHHKRGQYLERLALGNIAYDAATMVNDIYQQSRALVDDVAWSLSKIRLHAAALVNLRRARDIFEEASPAADDFKNEQLIAKAHRHSASILRSMGDFEAAEGHLLEAEAIYGNAPSGLNLDEEIHSLELSKVKMAIARALAGRPKAELDPTLVSRLRKLSRESKKDVSSLIPARAAGVLGYYHYANGDWERALASLTSAKTLIPPDIYRGERARVVASIGIVCATMGRLPVARLAFEEALLEAGRTGEYIRGGDFFQNAIDRPRHMAGKTLLYGL